MNMNEAELEKGIGSARGKIGYIRRLNPGAGRQLARRVKKTIQTVDISQPGKSKQGLAGKGPS